MCKQIKAETAHEIQFWLMTFKTWIKNTN